MTAIANRTLLITGAAKGLGRRLATEAARRGGLPVLWDLDEENLADAVAEIERAGGRARGYRCDVSRREEVYRVARRVEEEVGTIDVLVNNAGVVSGKAFLELPDERIERSFAVNAVALFWTVKAFLPAMVERNRGHLVTIASAAGLVGVSRLTDYCATKWAAVGFDEALRMELRRRAPGVKTTVVCPYYIDTGMFAGVRTRFPFLLPILKEEYVVARILSAIRRNRRRLITPRFVHVVPLLRVLPPGVFDALATFFGVDAAMDTFAGSSVKKAEPLPPERR